MSWTVLFRQSVFSKTSLYTIMIQLNALFPISAPYSNKPPYYVSAYNLIIIHVNLVHIKRRIKNV